MSSKRHSRNDHKAMAKILHRMGVTNYEEKVLSLMSKFTRNYVHMVMDEAYELARSSKKGTYDESDIKEAAEITKEKLFHKVPLTKAEILATRWNWKSSEEEEEEEQSSSSEEESDSVSESSDMEAITFDMDDFLQLIQTGGEEVSTISNTASSDDCHDQKTTENLAEKFKRSPTKEMPRTSFQSTEINNSELPPTVSEMQTDSPTKEMARTSFQPTEIDNSELLPTASEMQTDKEPWDSCAEVPSMSSIDDLIESVVNNACGFGSKSEEEGSDSVEVAPNIKKQRLKSDKKGSPAKKGATGVTSPLNSEIKKNKPSATSSKARGSRAKKRVAATSSESSAKSSSPASSSTSSRTGRKSQAKKGVTSVTSPSNTEINKDKPSATSRITKSSRAKKGVATTSSESSAKISSPASSSTSSKIGEKMSAQSPVETKSSASYGQSLLKLLEMYEADEEMEKEEKESLQKDDGQTLPSKNTLSSPTIIRIKHDIVEDDDYDAESS